MAASCNFQELRTFGCGLDESIAQSVKNCQEIFKIWYLFQNLVEVFDSNNIMDNFKDKKKV